jgi:hypothetical protein
LQTSPALATPVAPVNAGPTGASTAAHHAAPSRRWQTHHDDKCRDLGPLG